MTPQDKAECRLNIQRFQDALDYLNSARSPWIHHFSFGTSNDPLLTEMHGEALRLEREIVNIRARLQEAKYRWQQLLDNEEST